MFNYSKRINRELENDDITQISSSIKRKIRYKNDIIDIELSNKYPFDPPNKIYINNKLIDYNYNIDNDVKYILEKYYDITCFCCKSLMCKKNWKPTNTIMDILKENENNMILIEKIKKFLLITNLHNNKLPIDIYPLLLNYM
jgi:hypothetical protein